MKIRCTKCSIELRYREMALCAEINDDYGTDIQLCTDCFTILNVNMV